MEKKSAVGWGKKLGGLLKASPRSAEGALPEARIVLDPLRFISAQCLGCSACTLTCRAVSDGLAPSWFEPKLRFLGELGANSPCDTCQECAAVCPFGVSLHPRPHAG